jgi:hypothetical protein
MKKTIIIVIIILLAILCALAWLLMRKNQETSSVATVTIPSPVISPTSTLQIAAQPTGDTIDIGTSHGTVTVKNFYKSALGWEDAYLIFQKNATYELLYDTVDSSFVVSVVNGPLATTRAVAEAALLSALNITQSDACKLTVIVGIDPSVDRSFTGQALPLSFCVSNTFSK